MHAVFYAVLLVPLATMVAAGWSVWMRRAVLALVVPVLLGAMAWCGAVMPMAREAGACDEPTALFFLWSGGGLTVTLAATTALGTVLRFRSLEPRWTVLLPAAIAIVFAEVAVVGFTAWFQASWHWACFLS